ncbi:hypothetical protein C922_04684 [Plasmodium inui San Antonio 1]|uniref:Plasmodium RESA N-terminal domain-containing protein n=1 Tax=Plasmodium inui San Antonio 1 TaxID=1237626 RepID=W6ZVY7_9APIC|nr:hypothetical protein C922_04684 [Plasmodium inui San Antonio 1]EUD64952.1 hypothetical protein C922_04684 [Plasmodium inui San Antonio 1]
MKKALKSGFTLLGVISAFIVLLLFCVPQTKLMSRGGRRRARRLGRLLGGSNRMQEIQSSNINHRVLEDEPEWEECSYIGSDRDEMDHYFNEMWTRQEWLRRGKYRPRNSYDICPYGCTDADFLKELSELDINWRLGNLDSHVSVKEMFILWSNVHRQERKKYINMQERAKNFCDDLVETFDIPENVRIRVWMHVHRCMTSVFLRFERRHHKHFLCFLNHGPSSKIRFLRYIDRTRRVWNKRRMEIDNYWRSKMVNFFRTYSSRRFSRPYPRAGAHRGGAREYDNRSIRQQDRLYVGLYDRRNDGLYGSRDSSLYGRRDSVRYKSRDSVGYKSRDSVRYEITDGGVDERRNERLGESRSANFYESMNESIDESRSDGFYDSMNESLDDSRSEGWYDSVNESLDDSRSEGWYDSVNESPDDSRSEGSCDSMNEGLDNSINDSLYDSMNESLDDSRSEGWYDNVNESLDDSRSEGWYDSVNESLDDSRSEGSCDSMNEGLDNSISDSLYDSMNESLDEGRNEALDRGINGGMEELRGEDNA